MHLDPIARTFAAATDLPDLAVRVTSSAVEQIPGCDEAAITLLGPKHSLACAGATDTSAERLELLQHDSDQGPCLDALYHQPTVTACDICTDQRWPTLTAAIGPPVLHGVLCQRLYLGSDTIGVLSLYSAAPAALNGTDSSALAATLATHASIALTHQRTTDSLQSALESRGTIGTAVGLLMARTGHLTCEEAFDILRRASQRTNVKLRDIAAKIVSDTIDLTELDKQLNDAQPAGRI